MRCSWVDDSISCGAVLRVRYTLGIVLRMNGVGAPHPSGYSLLSKGERQGNRGYYCYSTGCTNCKTTTGITTPVNCCYKPLVYHRYNLGCPTWAVVGRCAT